MTAPGTPLPCPSPFLLRTRNLWRALALFLTVVGARFWLVERYATPLPYWDQWDGIGALILKPWLEGHLSWSALFAAHNEHRIFLTRVWTLGIFAANGQWDEWVEMAANAVFCGFSAVCLAGMLISELGRAHAGKVFLAVGLYFVLPFGWENTLCGFQSQNFFLVLFSLVAVWGLGFRAAGAGGWWLGLVALLLACLSMATGFFAGAVAGVVVGVRVAVRRRGPRGGEIVTFSVCLVAVAVGWFTRVDVPVHADLKAESFPAFCWAFLRFGAWPAYRFPLCALLVYLPTVLLVWRRVAHGSESDRRAGLVLAFSGWTLLQTAALAYGRGGHAAPPVVRYMDLLAIAPLVNFLAWTPLLHGWRRLPWRVAATFWTVLLAVGLWPEVAKDFTGWMPNYHQEMGESERNTHGYVATGDFDRFLVGKPIHGLPYPNPTLLASFLDDPTLRPILPADIRPPLLPDPPHAGFPASFFPNGLPPTVHPPPETTCQGSYTAAGSAAKGDLRARYTAGAGLPYVSLAFAGDLGGAGLSFTLKDPDSRRETVWHPAQPPGDRWHTDVLPVPARSFVLEATDNSDTGWFAFTAPVEVGFWSRWAAFALRRSAWLAGTGLGLAAFTELVFLLAVRGGKGASRQS